MPDTENQKIYGFDPYQESKNEEYMNDAQEEHFKSILGAWKQELMEEKLFIKDL